MVFVELRINSFKFKYTLLNEINSSCSNMKTLHHLVLCTPPNRETNKENNANSDNSQCKKIQNDIFVQGNPLLGPWTSIYFSFLFFSFFFLSFLPSFFQSSFRNEHISKYKGKFCKVSAPRIYVFNGLLCSTCNTFKLLLIEHICQIHLKNLPERQKRQIQSKGKECKSC